MATTIPYGHELIESLRRLGYVPPLCRSVTIDIQPGSLPAITVQAFVGPELAAWIETLKQTAVRVEIIDPCGEVNRTLSRAHLSEDEVQSMLDRAALNDATDHHDGVKPIPLSRDAAKRLRARGFSFSDAVLDERG